MICICHPAHRCGRCPDELATELAERNNECGYIKDGFICTQPKGHQGQHKGQQLERYLPFQ